MEECFQDTWNLYFVLELCEGGQFREFIEGNVGRVSDEVVAFYVGEIVNILEYLHGVGVVHRDLKVKGTH
jgi:3-phosphoinositide dependent protein kinase-1